MKINWADFGERVAWTTIQATIGAAVVVLSAETVSWEDGLKFILVTVLVAVGKVMAAQQAGDRHTGDAWPGGTM